MNTIKYIVGNERKEVVEKKELKDSIFASQYTQALSVIDNMIGKDTNDVLNIVAFCGERGTGKSSCMRTVLDILKEKESADWKEKNFIKEYDNLKKNKFHILDVSDPAFFDKQHNILEVVLGQMYISAKKYYKSNQNNFHRYDLNELMVKFDKVKECIFELRNSSQGKFDADSELSALACSLELQTEMSDLIDKFLKIFEKDKLVIPIDDIDLNVNEAYKMCEQIRKYLSLKNCFVFFAVKIDQLNMAVAGGIFSDMSRPYKGTGVGLNDYRVESFSMSKKYLDKFIPSSSRVYLPNVYNMSEKTLEIYDKEDDEPKFKKDKLKDGIVELIFQKTRYLFYNSEGGISPIVPNNLRELMHLLGLLMSMNDTDAYENNKKDRRQKGHLFDNQVRFKNYLFTEWIKCLSEDNRQKIATLIQSENTNSVNKLVCEILSDNFISLSEQDFSSNDEDGTNGILDSENNIVDIISDMANFSYNVSIGDIFHLINMIESDSLSQEQENLIFFIKAFYSIRLYETYDLVTEKEGALYPHDASENSNGIYRYDKRFNHTNALQRLVGGSYFSFEPAELLPRESSRERFKATVDTCVINIKSESDNGLNLRNIFESAKAAILKYKNEKADLSKDEKFIIQLAEFMMLCCTRTIDSDDKNSFSAFDSKYRKNVEPAFFRIFNSERQYYVFDCLAPFAAMTNPEFTYNRFELFKDLSFDDFLSTPCSLLRAMISQVYLDRGEYNSELKKEAERIRAADTEVCGFGKRDWLWTLQSDAVIRNAEVLAAVFQNAKSRRLEIKDKTGVEKIIKLYENIQNSNMKTHRISNNDDGYIIQFSFLTPIINFLKDIYNPNSGNLRYQNIIEDIIFSDHRVSEYYDSAEDFVKNGLKLNKRSYKKSTIIKRINNLKFISRNQKKFLIAVVPDEEKPLTVNLIDNYTLFEEDIKLMAKNK